MTAVRLRQRRAQPVRVGRPQDQMDVVGHQAPGQARHPPRPAARRDQLAIGGLILVREEDRLAAIAPAG
jgi:hypothetical protein